MFCQGSVRHGPESGVRPAGVGRLGLPVGPPPRSASHRGDLRRLRALEARARVARQPGVRPPLRRRGRRRRLGDATFGDASSGCGRNGSTFTARYRVGSGGAGNVGAEVLAHLVDDGVSGSAAAVLAVRTPAGRGDRAGAIGGSAPEGPYAFRTQERAVTPRGLRGGGPAAPWPPACGGTLPLDRSWRTVFVT